MSQPESFPPPEDDAPVSDAPQEATVEQTQQGDQPSPPADALESTQSSSSPTEVSGSESEPASAESTTTRSAAAAPEADGFDTADQDVAAPAETQARSEATPPAVPWQSLTDEIAELRSAFTERSKRDDETIRSLQTELSEAKRASLLDFVRPALQPLADLHAELLKSATGFGKVDETHQSQDLEYFAHRIEEILDRLDIISVEAAEGSPFDRREHAAVLPKTTEDPAQDQTIARVVRQGFRVVDHERVLIPARVSVWKYVTAEDSAASGDEEVDDHQDTPSDQTPETPSRPGE